MAGSDTTKRSLLWAVQLLAHRQDVQAKAYQSILDAEGDLASSSHLAQTRIEYFDALVKEIGRYFVVLRLALPKATHGTVRWNGATIPPKTLLFLNTWACAHGKGLLYLQLDSTTNRNLIQTLLCLRTLRYLSQSDGYPATLFTGTSLPSEWAVACV